ncbi:hypothetical protein [Kineococcus radiotolerans]|uniref:hypothetical protein n=1 Tax=Kineococcus radiotolerans TaxID=131568 RepID=UPI00003A42A7|nr:hypothetical protein [Kineococcus radiotolerans]
MTSDLTALAVLLVLLVFALAAPRWGADTRASREWSPGGPAPHPARRGEPPRAG